MGQKIGNILALFAFIPSIANGYYVRSIPQEEKEKCHTGMRPSKQM